MFSFDLACFSLEVFVCVLTIEAMIVFKHFLLTSIGIVVLIGVFIFCIFEGKGTFCGRPESKQSGTLL